MDTADSRSVTIISIHDNLQTYFLPAYDGKWRRQTNDAHSEKIKQHIRDHMEKENAKVSIIQNRNKCG